MTTNSTDEAYPAWLLILLFVMALLLVLVALYLWIWRPPDDGVVIEAPPSPTAAGAPSISPTPKQPVHQSATLEPAPSFTVAATAEATASPEATVSPTGGTPALVSPTAAATVSPTGGTPALVSPTAAATVSPTGGTPMLVSPTAAATVSSTGGTPALVSPTAAAVAIPTTALEPTATVSQPLPTETPTTTPTEAGTLAGQVALQGRGDASNVTLRVDGTPAATTEATGDFSITLPPGRHTIEASYPGYMTAQAVDVEVVSGETTTLAAVTLNAGDTDRDGDVDLYDVVRWVINFSRAAPDADVLVDINEDGVIDIRDLILIQRNYRSAMPEPWQRT